MKILVVDDHYATARLLKRYFEREGHEVTLFPNASWCLSEFKKDRFVVAFIDILLGEDLMNGIELAAELKKLDPEIKINLMSAFWSYEDKVMWAGFGDLVRKPFALIDLSMRLGR